jgi:hypothetical protein
LHGRFRSSIADDVDRCRRAATSGRTAARSAASEPSLTVTFVPAISHHTGIDLAEVGFLPIVIAGIWMVAAQILNPVRWGKMRHIVAGTALAVGGVLLIIATHWGHFG